MIISRLTNGVMFTVHIGNLPYIAKMMQTILRLRPVLCELFLTIKLESIYHYYNKNVDQDQA